MRKRAARRGLPAAAPAEPALDVRIEYVMPDNGIVTPAALPNFGGALAYTVGRALTPVDRTVDLVFTVGCENTLERLSSRVAFHRRHRTPCIGLALGEQRFALNGVLWMAREGWQDTFDDLLHAVFAGFLPGLVCVDWHEILAVLETEGRLVFAAAESNDPTDLAARVTAGLGLKMGARLRAAHATLYGAARLSDIRSFAGGLGAKMSAGGMLVYSMPEGRRGGNRFWGGLLGVA